MLAMPTAMLQSILTTMIALTPWSAMCVRLFKNNVIPSINSVLATFTEADFTGYAKSADLVWGTVGVDPNGGGQVFAGSVVFTQTGTATVNTVYGYYITDDASTPTILYWAELFPAPVNFSAIGDQVVIVPVLDMLNQAA